MGLFSPPKKLHVRVHARLLKLDFCKWYFSPIFTQPDQIKLFLLVLSNKCLINGYKHSGTLFLGSSYHYLLKNIKKAPLIRRRKKRELTDEHGIKYADQDPRGRSYLLKYILICKTMDSDRRTQKHSTQYIKYNA